METDLKWFITWDSSRKKSNQTKLVKTCLLCQKKHLAKGFCKKHYLKWWRRTHQIHITNYKKTYRKSAIKLMKKTLSKLGNEFHLRPKQYFWALFYWSQSVKERDNNNCQICGKNGNIAHHLIPKSIEPKLSLNINNGMTLCMLHHKEIHYGLPR